MTYRNYIRTRLVEATLSKDRRTTLVLPFHRFLDRSRERER